MFLAAYLALLQPLLLGTTGTWETISAILVAFGVLIGLFAIGRWGNRAVERLLGAESDELMTLLFVGFAIFVAGFSEWAGASDAIGALMAGMIVAGTRHARRVERLVVPLRDTFAAVFFIWFGTTINPEGLAEVWLAVTGAIAISLVFNLVAGTVAARVYGYGRSAAANAATLLVSRGEFELILASLAVAAGLDDRVASFAALYVFVLAVLSPLLAARSDQVAKLLPQRLFRQRPSPRVPT